MNEESKLDHEGIKLTKNEEKLVDNKDEKVFQFILNVVINKSIKITVCICINI
jgi:hypothetical protein